MPVTMSVLRTKKFVGRDLFFGLFCWKGETDLTDSLLGLPGILESAPTEAKFWALRTTGEGGMIDLHPPIAVGNNEWPLISGGRYFLQYYDSSRKPLGGGRLIQYELPSTTSAAQARQAQSAGPKPQSEPESEVADASAGIGLDAIGRRELEARKLSEHHRGTLDYYTKLMQTLGIRGQQKIQDKVAQATLIAEHTKRILEQSVELQEKVAERLQRAIIPPPPPEPTPWDKIIGAAAPAFAVIYTETIRAIKGMPSSEAAQQNDKLLLPDSGAHAKIYEVLGRVGTSEKLSEVLTDQSKMAAWMTELLDVMGAARGKTGAPQAEGENAK